MAPAFLYAQLAHEIIHLIDKGTFQPGEKLPSLRSLSENLSLIHISEPRDRTRSRMPSSA